MKKNFFVSLRIFAVLTVVTGIIYPLLITGIALVLFPEKSGGSLIVRNNIIVGSSLIGQNYDSTRCFWSRPSATGYNAMPSGGSNLGPTSKILVELTMQREKNFRIKNNLDKTTEVPAEMIFASASGLDPHISQKSALLQIDRVAEARGFTKTEKAALRKKVFELTEDPQFHILGKQRINVTLLNLELDTIK